MSRFLTFSLIITGVLIVFYFGGLMGTETPTSQLFDILLHPENMSFSSFFKDKILFTVTASTTALAGVFLGYKSGNIELGLMTTITLWLGTTLWDFSVVYMKVAETIPVLATIIFGPLFFILALTLIDWWRKADG